MEENQRTKARVLTGEKWEVLKKFESHSQEGESVWDVLHTWQEIHKGPIFFLISKNVAIRPKTFSNSIDR
jgi:hypothetical protein